MKTHTPNSTHYSIVMIERLCLLPHCADETTKSSFSQMLSLLLETTPQPLIGVCVYMCVCVCVGVCVCVCVCVKDSVCVVVLCVVPLCVCESALSECTYGDTLTDS